MDISKLQICLNALGFGTLEVNGTIDRKTRKTLKQYQRAMGLKATGKLDEKTENSLQPRWDGGTYINERFLTDVPMNLDTVLCFKPIKSTKNFKSIKSFMKYLKRV